MHTVSLDMESAWGICHQTKEDTGVHLHYGVTFVHEKEEILSSVIQTTRLILQYTE